MNLETECVLPTLSRISPRKNGKLRGELPLVGDLIEAGKVSSVIDRVYPLSEAAEAHECMEKVMQEEKQY